MRIYVNFWLSALAGVNYSNNVAACCRIVIADSSNSTVLLLLKVYPSFHYFACILYFDLGKHICKENNCELTAPTIYRVSQ